MQLTHFVVLQVISTLFGNVFGKLGFLLILFIAFDINFDMYVEIFRLQMIPDKGVFSILKGC